MNATATTTANTVRIAIRKLGGALTGSLVVLHVNCACNLKATLIGTYASLAEAEGVAAMEAIGTGREPKHCPKSTPVAEPEAPAISDAEREMNRVGLNAALVQMTDLAQGFFDNFRRKGAARNAGRAVLLLESVSEYLDGDRSMIADDERMVEALRRGLKEMRIAGLLAFDAELLVESAQNL